MKKIPNTSGLVTTTVPNTKIGEAENKILGASGLVMKTDYGAKIKGIQKNILLLLIIINLQLEYLMQR